MKVPAIYFTDLHVNKYSQFSQHRDRLEDCLKVIDDVFKMAKRIDAKVILFGGDLGDTPKHIYIQVINALMIRLSKWFTKYPDVAMYAISGNHDQSSKNYYDTPAETFLQVFATAFPDNFILLDNTAHQLNDKVAIFGVPYYEKRECFERALDSAVQSENYMTETAKKVLLIHQTPAGGDNPHIKPDTDPNDPRYNYFDLVLCGHIHNKKIIKSNFIVGGNPLHRDLGDIGIEKGFWILDLADPANTIEFISRKGRYPEFIRKKPSDITQEDSESNFIIPVVSATDVAIPQSADAAKFNTSLSQTDLMTNYFKHITDGTDDKLLKVGLSLIP